MKLSLNRFKSVAFFIGAALAIMAVGVQAQQVPIPTIYSGAKSRNYWPEQSVIDGTWKPPDVVKAH